MRAEIPAPEPLGSYSPEDVIFLLKDIGQLVVEQSNEERERAMQADKHYSEMLPIEYRPSVQYINLFYQSLQKSATDIAKAVGIVASAIYQLHGDNVVLVSLARAGTPIGVLIKRYFKQYFGIDIPHYSISIIRDRGIDENALFYILQHHSHVSIQFVDGWTGKGAITKELIKSLNQFEKKYSIKINSELAVLADPGYCANIFGTREDFLIPSACLNSTVSGLMSRTVLRPDLIGPLDFHGAKYYQNLQADDLSNFYVDSITEHFTATTTDISAFIDHNPSWLGLKNIENIQQEFGIKNINLIKPGVGETTRVLLRRVPWQVLVRDQSHPHLEHIMLLANERGVPVVEYPNLAYCCCGLIKPMEKK
ncbi:cysteine protease StiP family protein [Peptococcaceae bacterium 1198_IL3148]